MSRTAKDKLPPLIFGHMRSRIDLDLLQMQDRVNRITNWVSEYDTLGKNSPFLHRTSVYAVNNVRLIAVASTPTVMKVCDPDCTIALPLRGALRMHVGSTILEAPTSELAMFFPEGNRHVEGDVKSVLLISISKQRLLHTAEVMLGKYKAHQLDLDTHRLLRTRHGAIDFVQILNQTCLLIDHLGGDPQLLKNFSPDENVVRAVVMMLSPGDFLDVESDIPRIGKSRNDVIDFLCDYVAANLDQTINLTTLESISGISGRVLQQEFKKRHHCSPLQWVREQRLVNAHSLLMHPTVDTRISTVAAMCGFNNFSEFAKSYAIRYGELPSETLRNKLNLTRGNERT